MASADLGIGRVQVKRARVKDLSSAGVVKGCCSQFASSQKCALNLRIDKTPETGETEIDGPYTESILDHVTADEKLR